MANEHSHRTKTFRPDPQEYADAKTVLRDRSWPMETFLRACLRCLRDRPDELLTLLAPHRPAPRPLGRRPTEKQSKRAMRPAGQADSRRHRIRSR